MGILSDELMRVVDNYAKARIKREMPKLKRLAKQSGPVVTEALANAETLWQKFAHSKMLVPWGTFPEEIPQYEKAIVKMGLNQPGKEAELKRFRKTVHEEALRYFGKRIGEAKVAFYRDIAAEGEPTAATTGAMWPYSSRRKDEDLQPEVVALAQKLHTKAVQAGVRSAMKGWHPRLIEEVFASEPQE
jgi:hypothetical protein